MYCGAETELYISDVPILPQMLRGDGTGEAGAGPRKTDSGYAVGGLADLSTDGFSIGGGHAGASHIEIIAALMRLQV
jgi:hypothetical protein